MNAIPAIVAGVKRIVMINPGLKENKILQYYMQLVNVKLKKFIQSVDHQRLQRLLMEQKK